MAVKLFAALPPALLWMLLTNQPSLEGFAVGYVLGLALALAFAPEELAVRWRKLPGQVLALFIYVALLFWDILRSGIDVARRVLSPKMDLKPGVLTVPTCDPQMSAVIAALSAGAITLTPGELVVELTDDCNMFVHCLDVESSEASIYTAQEERLALFLRIIGRT